MSADLQTKGKEEFDMILSDTPGKTKLDAILGMSIGVIWSFPP